MRNRLFRILSLDEFMKLVKRQIKTFRLFRRILIICFLKTVNIYSYWIQAKRLLVKYKSVNNTHSEEGEEDSLTKALWIFSSFNISGVWVFFSAPKTCGARVLFRSPKCGALQMFCPPGMKLGRAATLKSAESVEASPPSGLSWRIQATFLEQIST